MYGWDLSSLITYFKNPLLSGCGAWFADYSASVFRTCRTGSINDWEMKISLSSGLKWMKSLLHRVDCRKNVSPSFQRQHCSWPASPISNCEISHKSTQVKLCSNVSIIYLKINKFWCSMAIWIPINEPVSMLYFSLFDLPIKWYSWLLAGGFLIEIGSNKWEYSPDVSKNCTILVWLYSMANSRTFQSPLSG